MKKIMLILFGVLFVAQPAVFSVDSLDSEAPSVNSVDDMEHIGGDETEEHTEEHTSDIEEPTS